MRVLSILVFTLVLFPIILASSTDLAFTIDIVEPCEPLHDVKISAGETFAIAPNTTVLTKEGNKLKTTKGTVKPGDAGNYTIQNECSTATLTATPNLARETQRVTTGQQREIDGRQTTHKQYVVYGILTLTTLVSVVLVWKR